MDLKQILEQLRENDIQYIESVYYEYSGGEINVVCKYQNGRIYNQYNALDKGSSLVGPYIDINEAEEYLIKHRPHSTKIWENSEGESAAGNLNLTYTTDFYLACDVLDLCEAQEYLTEDDMTKYALEDMGIPKSGRDKIEHIEWHLTQENKGYIEVKTNNYLTEKESKAISDWISGQNSDGLGEGFEQQDFAYYDTNDYYGNDYYSDEDEDEDYYDDCNWVMASFDWQTNDYVLKLQEE